LDYVVKAKVLASSEHLLLNQEVQDSCEPYNEYGTIKDELNETNILQDNAILEKLE